MEITKALLEKFLANQCNSKEGELVYQYLLQNPQLLDELLNEQEWNAFTSDDIIEKHRSDAWLAAIQQRKHAKKRIAITWKRWLSIAAAVVLAVSVIVYQYVKHSGNRKVQQVVVLSKATKTPAPLKKKLINNGLQPLTYTLEDSSVITLYKNSTIECEQPFEADKRIIVLHGEALFKVAKDKSRPFTVFTDHFSTTALGTVFRINAYSNNSWSKVQLISGKVVVTNLQHTAKEVYLLPGEACSFSEKDNRLRTHTGKPASRNPLAVTETEDVIIFSNTPLQEVLNTIGRVYKITIYTGTIQLKNRKFTGTFFKTDPPDEPLNTIAALNDFIVTKEGTGYYIEMKNDK